MLEPLLPSNETERLEALRRLEVLDTPAEERFDRLTRLAMTLFDVPIALISLVDSHRQWFKSRQGIEACETGRDVSFCGHAILGTDILHVPNALEDPRFADNPLVTAEPDIRFYAGAPLSTPDGYRVGTLCLIDRRPRRLTGDQLASLRDLADSVQDELARTFYDSLLHDLTARLDRAIAGTSDGLWEWEVPTGKVWYAPRFKELLGYADSEFPNVLDSFASHLHPDDADATWTAVDAHLEEREPYDVDYRLRTKSGDYRWFHARGQAVWDDDGKPLLMSGSIMDVTGRKEAEQELIEARDAAEESNRMKSEFLNMMSHELRTPLTVLLGYLPLLRDAEKMPPADLIAGMAGDMKQAGDHLLQVINDLLDLSKIEAGRMELKRQRVALSEIVDEVLGHLRPKAEDRGLALSSRVGDLQVLADPLRLRQILINLVGNAVKFTEEGTISVTARAIDGGIELEVRDTGIGIPEQDLAEIFDRFRQVDSSSTRKVGGTGLGLAITRSLVELHGGAIRAASRLGEGSTFTLTLMDGLAGDG